MVRPTPEQNDQINAGIAADPDTRELTEKDFERMRLAADVHPEIVEAYRRSRGKQQIRGQSEVPQITLSVLTATVTRT